jgi:hypothetical protein
MSWDKNDDAWGITILDRFNDTYFAATEQRNDIRRTDIEKIVKMALERSREDTIKEARENILVFSYFILDITYFCRYFAKYIDFWKIIC